MKVVIIGGVAGGASAAARLRRLDERAEIVILEKGRHVSFANCGLPYHIGGIIADREALLLQTPAGFRSSFNIDVRCGHEALAIDRRARQVVVRDSAAGREYREAYDALVLAPGAVPARPPLPGADHPLVFTLRTIDDMDHIKAAVDGGARRVVIVGAGYIGLELAENLAERGMRVDVVELQRQILPVMDREMTADIERHIAAQGVKLHLGKTVESIAEDHGRLAVRLGGNEVLTADCLVLAVGVKPDTALAQAAGLELGPRGGIKVDAHMRTSDPAIYAAGDAVEVVDFITGAEALIPLAGPANRQGRIVADNIAGGNSVYSATQGTAIVKVFEMTAGCTGASEKALKRFNIPYRKIYIHPTDHARYYPGASQMHIKLLCDPRDGRVLGGQVVGSEGIDKRVDILAVAVRAGLTVQQLAELELAYAPPYGSAKDPVNMAGFVAANLLLGKVAFWYAEDYPERTAAGTIVDVRSPREFDEWHIPGAVNLPLGKLRSQYSDLPKDKPVFLYCLVGFRSYLAYRILAQLGFRELATLAGGTLTFTAWHGTKAP